MALGKPLRVSIERPAELVYEFLRQPENFPRWASWTGQTNGAVTVRFSDHNRRGVLDHAVERADGESFYIPLRVIPNGAGCDLVLGLFRPAGVRDEEFAAAAEHKLRALFAAKQILEAEHGA